MIKGFKEFILRGNVIDLAVAVVIGAAFTLIVNSIVAGLINPLIALIFQADSLNEVGLDGHRHLSGNEVVFAFGAILGAIINFLAVAVVVYFVFVFPMNTVEGARRREGGHRRRGGIELPTEQELLVQIRDLLATQGIRAPVAATALELALS